MATEIEARFIEVDVARCIERLPSETAIQKAADALGLCWSQAEFGGGSATLEKHYGLESTAHLRYFTFDRVE